MGAAVSYLLLAVTAALYLLRLDWAAAFTLLPPLTWVVLGVLLAALSRRAKRVALPPLVGWLLFAVIFVEPIRSGLRPGFRITDADRAPGTTIRVVSLNCAGGSVLAAKEVAAMQPDIVLLQESPSKKEVEALARSLFGERRQFVAGPDASIVTRMPLRPLDLPRRTSNFVAADTVVEGIPARIVSLRLSPPLGRVDLWNPECWREQTKNLVQRREEMAELLGQACPGPDTVLMGGDFNAVAGDASLSPLANLRDSFDEAGRGWCDTAVNDYPFARIDRLYVVGPFEVLSSCVFKTKHSDHRMLVIDLKVTRESTP